MCLMQFKSGKLTAAIYYYLTLQEALKYILLHKFIKCLISLKNPRGLLGFLMHNLNSWSDSCISESPSKERQKYVEVRKSAAGKAST